MTNSNGRYATLSKCPEYPHIGAYFIVDAEGNRISERLYPTSSEFVAVFDLNRDRVLAMKLGDRRPIVELE